MRQLLPSLIVSLLFVVPLVGQAFQPDSQAGKPDLRGGEKDKTPEEVFKAFTAALKKNDVKAGMSHLTLESQDSLTAKMFFALVVGKAMLDKDIKTTPDGEVRLKRIEETLKRHGLSGEASLENLKKRIEASPNEFWIGLKKTAAAIKDQPAFVADVLEFSILGDFGADGLGFKDRGEANIKDIKIDGDGAQGTATFPGVGAFFIKGKGTETVYFQRQNGVWKIDAIKTAENRPSPSSQTQPPSYVPPQPEPGPVRRVVRRIFGG